MLACRLNLGDAANLLLRLGRASKSQQDPTVFYDAERWKQEGQLEKIKAYLKCTEKDMLVAQINGNYKIYRELCELSETLESQSFRHHPDMLPALTKVLNESQDADDFVSHSFIKPTKPLKPAMPSTLKPLKSTHLPSYAESYMQNNKSNLQHRYVRIKSATSSFISSSASPSSPSSSSVYWSSNSKRHSHNSEQQTQQLASNSTGMGT